MKLKRWLRDNNLLAGLLAAGALMLLALAIQDRVQHPWNNWPAVSFARLAQEVGRGEVVSLRVPVDSRSVLVTYQRGHKPLLAQVTEEPETNLIATLQQYGVTGDQLRRVEITVTTPSARAP